MRNRSDAMLWFVIVCLMIGLNAVAWNFNERVTDLESAVEIMQVHIGELTNVKPPEDDAKRRAAQYHAELLRNFERQFQEIEARRETNVKPPEGGK